MSKDRRLGKGLAALLGTPDEEPNIEHAEGDAVLSIHRSDEAAPIEQQLSGRDA